MSNSLSKYEVIIFDSDGVILNSNILKEKAFLKLTKEFKINISETKLNNLLYNFKGKSRYEIIKYISLLEANNNNLYKELLLRYSVLVNDELLSCESSKNLASLREKNNSLWLVLTAGDQKETITIYKKKGIYDFFDLGILGAPSSKKENIKYLNKIHKNILKKNILYIGDSINDLIIAEKYNFDFVLIKEWTTCKEISSNKFKPSTLCFSTLDKFIIKSLS